MEKPVTVKRPAEPAGYRNPRNLLLWDINNESLLLPVPVNIGKCFIVTLVCHILKKLQDFKQDCSRNQRKGRGKPGFNLPDGICFENGCDKTSHLRFPHFVHFPIAGGEQGNHFPIPLGFVKGRKYALVRRHPAFVLRCDLWYQLAGRRFVFRFFQRI